MSLKKSPSERLAPIVWRLLKQIPRGQVTTYGEIARCLGSKKKARLVGKILARNKNITKVPCYKVVRSDGTLGGYNAGRKMKIRRLEKDGLWVRKGKIVGFVRVIHRFHSG